MTDMHVDIYGFCLVSSHIQIFVFYKSANTILNKRNAILFEFKIDSLTNNIVLPLSGGNYSS